MKTLLSRILAAAVLAAVACLLLAGASTPKRATLEPDKLIILSNVPGLLRQFPDEATLIPRIELARVGEFTEHAQGRMRIKVLGAMEALQMGVGQVIFADGRIASPVHAALAGHGTVIG